MRQLLAVIKKDLRIARRDPRFLGPSLIVPFVILMVYTVMWTSFGSGGESFSCGLVVLDQSEPADEMADIIKNMKSSTNYTWFTIEEHDAATAEQLFQQGDLIAYIVIPTGFGDNITSGEKASVIIHINNLNDDINKNYIHRVEVAVLLYNQEALSPDFDQSDALVALNEVHTLEMTPGNVEYAAAAAIILSLITCSLAGQGLNTAADFENKAIHDTLNSPTPRHILVLGHTLAAIPRSMIVLAITYPIITLWVGVQPAGNPLVLLGIVLLATLALTPLGELIGVLAREKEQAILGAVLLTVLGFLAGGGLAPVSLMPFQFRVVSLFIPVTYVIALWARVFFYDTLSGLLPSIIALVAIWILCTLAVVLLTRREVER
jgi:ABC-type multidrug transport system permease subunit